MIRSLEARAGTVTEVEPVTRARLLLVGDFSASRVGNASVAEEFAVRLKSAGDVVITTSASTLRPLRFADMLATTLFVRNRVDVAIVDVYSGLGFIWAEWVTKLLRGAGVPVIHVLRGGNLPSFAKTNGARLTRLLESSDATVALSGYLYEQLSEYGAIAEIIPNPIDVSDYRFRLRAGAAPKLVWLRGFNEIYNPTLAPRMMHELLAGREPQQASGTASPASPPHLTMIGADTGDGTKRATLDTVARLGLESTVTIRDAVAKPKVPGTLVDYDIFINTTNVDNVPISVIEALATGLCVVSTDVGGLPYLLQDGVDALLVPKDDPQAMAAAVNRIINDPELAAHLSRNGRAKAESFDWAQVMPRWRRLIGKVAGEGRTRR